MQDVMRRNPLVITGTPTLLTPGALSIDTNPALRFNGSTNSGAAADSTSLSFTGSCTFEFLLRVSSLPGTTKTIIRKTNSFSVQLNSTGKIIFNCINGGSSVAVTSLGSIGTNTWYLITCVLNQEYNGAQQFGKTSSSGTFMSLDDDNGNNKVVSKFTLPEAAILNQITAKLQYFDEIWHVDCCAVVYADNGTAPSGLVAASAVQDLYSPPVNWRADSDVVFPLQPVLVPAGDYNLGLITDTVAGIPKVAIRIPIDTTGGDLVKRPGQVTSPEDPFGSPVVSNDDVMAIYCDYTAVGRTGLEGKAMVYINDILDNSAAYTSGIADTASSFEVMPDLAGDIDEGLVWDRPLTPLEISEHQMAR